MDPKEKLLQIVSIARGDDLERAERAFRGLALDQQHGESGKTRAEILAGYQQDRNEWQAAFELAKSL